MGDICVTNDDVGGQCDDNNSAAFTQVRRRQNKKSKKADLSSMQTRQSVTASGDASQPVNATTEDCSSKKQGDTQDTTVYVEPNCDHRCGLSEDIITSLKLEVKELNEKVKILSTQVETLTAALGLASNCSSTSSQSSSQSSTIQPCAITDMSNTTSAPTKSYAAATAGNLGVQQVHQQIHRNMVSAVYVDLEEKKKRASNVVICGLTNDESFDDKAVITGMIFQEFGRQVTVKSTRRLGKKIEGKTQNVLAVLSSIDDVSYLISNARLLRQSRNEFVRNNIYINADLTPAEAKASFELRCARRRRIPASQTGGKSNAVAVQPTEPSATPVTMVQLSATATPFAPSQSSVNDDQRQNSTLNQVSESDTRKSQSISVSAGVSTGAYDNVSNNASNISQSFQ